MTGHGGTGGGARWAVIAACVLIIMAMAAGCVNFTSTKAGIFGSPAGGGAGGWDKSPQIDYDQADTGAFESEGGATLNVYAEWDHQCKLGGPAPPATLSSMGRSG